MVGAFEMGGACASITAAREGGEREMISWVGLLFTRGRGMRLCHWKTSNTTSSIHALPLPDIVTAIWTSPASFGTFPLTSARVHSPAPDVALLHVLGRLLLSIHGEQHFDPFRAVARLRAGPTPAAAWFSPVCGGVKGLPSVPAPPLRLWVLRQ